MSERLLANETAAKINVHFKRFLKTSGDPEPEFLLF
jgi:hypothetical protein